jgi:hypothetical protein
MNELVNILKVCSLMQLRVGEGGPLTIRSKRGHTAWPMVHLEYAACHSCMG